MLNDTLPGISEIKHYKVQDLVLELEENDSTDLLPSSKNFPKLTKELLLL